MPNGTLVLKPIRHSSSTHTYYQTLFEGAFGTNIWCSLNRLAKHKIVYLRSLKKLSWKCHQNPLICFFPVMLLRDAHYPHSQQHHQPPPTPTPNNNKKILNTDGQEHPHSFTKYFLYHAQPNPANFIEYPLSFLNSSWDLTGGKHYQKIIITVFGFVLQNLLFQVTSLIFFSVAIFSPHFFRLVCYCSMWLHFSQGTS